MSEPNTTKFFLRTFGGLSIEVDGAAWNGLANQRKALGLLALLAVAGARGLSREKLLAFLWPESDTDQARNALSQLLFRVRRELGGDAVLGNNELRLNPDFASDVAVVLKAANDGHMELLVDTYTGPFLDGVYLKDAPDFERWAADERRRLEKVFLDALERLARHSTREGNHSVAVRWTGRLVAADPLSARAAKLHIEALVAAEDRESALRFGSNHAALVRTQLETEPDPEITRLLERLRTTVVAPTSDPLDESSGPRVMPATSPVADAGFRHALKVRRTTTNRRRLIAALGVSVIVIASVVVAIKVARTPDSRHTIVLVAPFENAAGDTTLNGIGRVAEVMLTEALQRTGLVGVVDGRGVMAAPKVTDSQDARRAVLSGIVDRTDATMLVAGQIFRRGPDSLEFRSRLVDAQSGRVLEVLSPVRLRPDAPDSALRELSDRVNGALGALVDPRLATLREPGAVAPRFEAYREFVEGIDFFAGKRSARFDYRGSIPHFARASQLDTAWNLPIIWLQFAYGNLGDRRAADSVVRVLEQRRDRLAPLDRYALEYFLARRRRDDDAAYRAAAAAAKLAPASNWTYLLGSWASDRRYDDEAIAAFRQLDADGGWIQSWIYYRIAFASALHLRGHFDDELALAREGVRRSPDPNMYGALFRALGARGEAHAVDRLADSIALLPNAILLQSRTGGALGEAAAEASVHGYPEVARHLGQRCVDWLRTHPPGMAPPSVPSERQMWPSSLGHCLFILERWGEAREQYFEAAQYDDWFGGMAMIRLILITLRQGDSVAARHHIAEAHARPKFLPDSMHRGMLDALLAATAGDARGTVAHLGKVKGFLGWRSQWHGRVEITPSLRRSIALRPLLVSR
jgi:DNA-binding SARP family transcriptional activator